MHIFFCVITEFGFCNFKEIYKNIIIEEENFKPWLLLLTSLSLYLYFLLNAGRCYVDLSCIIAYMYVIGMNALHVRGRKFMLYIIRKTKCLQLFICSVIGIVWMMMKIYSGFCLLKTINIAAHYWMYMYTLFVETIKYICNSMKC